MPTVAAIAVLLFFGGLFVIAMGWKASPVTQRPTAEPGRFTFDSATRQQLGLSLLLGLVTLALTRWVGLFVAVTAVTFSMTGLYRDRQRRAAALERLRAVAIWLEMMRDTIVAGAGISSAVKMTAERAPANIEPEVRRLSARLESSSFETAISRFGVELDIPQADSGVAALAMVSRSAGGNLGQLLTVVVDSIRRQVDQAARIEALRMRFLTSAALMVAVTVVTSALILMSSRELRAPYNSVVGQLVLLMVGGFYGLAIFVLRRMGKAEEPVRIGVGAQP